MADWQSVHGDILDAIEEFLQRLEGPDGAPCFKHTDVAWDFPPAIAFPAAIILPTDDSPVGGTNASEDLAYNDNVLVAVKSDESPHQICWIRQALRERLWVPDTTNAIPHAYDVQVTASPIMSGTHRHHGNLVVTMVQVRTIVAERREA